MAFYPANNKITHLTGEFNLLAESWKENVMKKNKKYSALPCCQIRFDRNLCKDLWKYITFYGLMWTIKLENFSFLLWTVAIRSPSTYGRCLPSAMMKCIDRLSEYGEEWEHFPENTSIYRNDLADRAQKNLIRSPLFGVLSAIVKVHMANHNTPLNSTTVFIIPSIYYVIARQSDYKSCIQS